MIVTLKVPLYPSKEQLRYFNSMSDAYHFLQNKAVEYLRGSFTSEKELRDYLCSFESDLPLSFVCTVVAKEKYKTCLRYGQSRLRFHRYSKSRKSFPVRCDANGNRDSRIYLVGSCIKIPSIPWIVIISRNWMKKNRHCEPLLYGGKQTARVIFDGKYWYLVFTYNTDTLSLPLKDKVVGIDLGIKTLATTSDNECLEGVSKTAKYKRVSLKIKGLQRIISRKYHKHGNFNKSNNIKKLERKVMLLHRRLRNLRDNNLHQVSKFLVDKGYKKIAFETLNIRGMIKNRRLSKAITDQGWYNLIQYTKYKAQFYGEELVQVSRSAPTSKTCSCCGNIKENLTLGDRVYVCDRCGLKIDRDYNAAINIRNLA